LNPTPISSRDGLLELSGGSIVLDMSQVVSSCLCGSLSASSEYEYDFLSLADGVGFPKHIVRSPPRFEFQPSPLRVVPSCFVNSIGHLESCFFDPRDHLLLCPAYIVNERWDAIDQHFLVVDSPVRFDPVTVDIESPVHVEPTISKSVQELLVNRLSRSERNLLIA
jgi:hypothetical protein